MIAREVEARGISTVMLSSAYTITQAVNPPRALYVDFPLGHTAGKPHDKAGQRRILREALTVLESAQAPGELRVSKEQWHTDDAWKDRVMRPAAADDETEEHEDDRTERHATPQYQSAADAQAADATCASCLWLE